jgi:hypothetical protein
LVVVGKTRELALAPTAKPPVAAPAGR